MRVIKDFFAEIYNKCFCYYVYVTCMSECLVII